MRWVLEELRELAADIEGAPESCFKDGCVQTIENVLEIVEVYYDEA